MKRLLTACCLALFCGCATINNRVVGNNDITETYQCTVEGIALCTFTTCPQVLSMGPWEWGWINVVTVPVGVCCFIVDVPIEFVCDTICYPYDYYQANKYKSTELP